MAQLISGTTIAGHSAIHAGNLSAHSIATTSYVTTQINNLINGAPGALDTLNELAAALGNDASFSSTLTSSIAGKVSKAGDTITGKITFPSAVANRPQFPGGMVGLDVGDGNFDIWGISRDYYPSNATAANAWGLRWNGNANDFEFVGGGTSRVILDMDGGNLTITGTISASGYNASNWNTAYGWGNHASAGYLTSLPSHNHDGRYLLLSGGTLTGDLLSTHPYYPGYNNAAVGSQGSYYLYGDTGNSGIRTNGNFLANGDIYLGTRGNWLSTYLNQAVRTDSSPSFSSVTVGGSQLTGTNVNGLANMMGVTSLPYSVDITVDGDPDRFYAVQFWGGDQDVWRRIIIKRGYGETAPWDPIGTGAHHGGLLLDWEGNFGGWGGAEYADRLRVFNESYTNVCADMFIYSHSMSYVFMLRGGGAVYHLFSDQPINGYYQAGAPDILYSASTLSYDDNWSGTNVYDVYAPTPLTLGQVNSSRIDGLRTKKQSLLDGRYLRQGIDISGIGNITTTNSYATNFFASNAFYLNGASYYLNSTNGGIYTNARFETASNLVVGGNVGIGTSSPGYKLETIGNARISGNLSIGTTYNGFAANIEGTVYVIGASVWVTDGYGYANASSSTGMYPDSSHNISFKSNNSTKVYINASGNVGIGTTSPSQKLHVSAGNFLISGTAIGNGADANSGLRIVAPISTTHYNWMLGAQQNINSAFEITPSTTVGGTTFSTPTAVFLQNGNVGIGTTSPSYPLDVRSSTQNTTLQILNAGTAGLGTSTAALRFGNADSYTSTFTLSNGGITLNTHGNVSPFTVNGTLTVSGVITATGGNSTNWNTAYSWGNHTSGGYLRLNTWEGNSYIGTSGAHYGTVFYDANDTSYYVDPSSTSNLSNVSVVGYQYIGGQTSNGQSNYQWDGADYRNPGDWTARLILRKDNATTGINGSIPSLVIFNNNGANQTTASMVFATNECVTGSNSVNLAGIIAKKESVGNCGGWSAGSLNFFVKNYGARVDSLALTPDGNATFSGIVYSTGYGNSSQWNTAYSWGNHASAGYAASSHTHTFASLTSKPTTIAGYGITDAITTGNIGSQSVSYSNQVGINYNNNSNANYQLLWGSGNSVYGTAEVYVNPSNDHIYASGFYAGSDIYLGTRGTWLSSWLNQSVQTGANVRFSQLGLGAAADTQLSVAGTGHISDYLYLGGTAGALNSWGTRTSGFSGYWRNASRDVTFTNEGYGSTWTFAINSAGAVTINRHIDANTVWGTAGATTIFMGWNGGKIMLGNGNDGAHDWANAIGGNSIISTNKHHFYKGAYIRNNVDGAEVLAVDGVNGRLFTVTDSVLDTIYSVNTIAGLPILEVLANNTVRIGKYGANSITIANSNIAINSDSVDAKFPFYVSDRSTATARYNLTNPGMGFNLADSYAQLQLYGTAGAYIDFTTGATDYQGRIMWTGSAFSIIGSMSWGGATLSNAVWNGTAISDSYISSASTWNTAYNKRPTGVSFSGGSTKTLTLTQGDGSTLTASFNDTDTNTDSQTLSISGNTLSISGGNSVTLSSSGMSQATADGRYLYYRGINQESDFQIFQDGGGEVRFDQINNYNNLSNPPGGYHYGGVLSLRGDNFGFQLWGSHTGDFFFKTQWNNDQYSGWRTVIHSSNIGSQSVNYASTAGTAQNISAYTINQSVGTGNAPTFTNIYNNAWFRTNNVNEGVYNQATGVHFYSHAATGWTITGSGGVVELVLRSNHQTTIRGYVYADTSNQIGFLTNDGNWGLQVDSSKNVKVFGADLTVGNTTSSNIYMTDTDESTRRIHCNSGRIGFLTTSNGWGAYCDNSGNWFANNLSGTNTGDQTNISGNAATATSAATLTGSSTVNGYLTLATNWGVSPYTSAFTIIGIHPSMTFRGSNGDTHYLIHMDSSGDIQYYFGPGYTTNNWTQRYTFTKGGNFSVLTGNISASGTVTGSNLSGTNTGDQTNISGNAATATTAARATRANGNFYIDDNYGNSIVGVYSSTILQGVFAMGDAYKLTAGGGAGNLYGLAWSHPNAGGVASNLNTHGLLVMENGTFLAAISGSIRARDDMRAPAIYDSGSRVAISRGEGRNYVDYSRYVYNNGAYSGVGWTEPSDLGVRYASSAGSVAWSNVSGRPTTVSSFSNDSGYITSGSNVVGLYSSGWGSSNFTWYQTPGGLAPYGGSWASFLVSNHGDGSNYYNQTIIMPFWGVPQYSRREGGANRGPYTFWTTENYDPNSISGNFYASGTITAGSDVVAYSDARIKTNIQTINNALEKVLSLRGVTYMRTDSDDTREKIGVIAQEVQKVLPQVVFEQSNGILGVSYGNMIGVLIEAIKEQQAQIEDLKEEVKKLRGE